MSLDADAISRLYETHAGGMLGFFVRRIHEPEAAVDLVADTFVAAFADRHNFRGDSDAQAGAWLYGIARHRLADFQRRGYVERRALDQIGFQRRALSDDEYERVEQLADLAHVRRRFVDGVHGLRDEQRRVLQLRVMEERPYADVAHALGVSEQAARARVSRALRALREIPGLAAAVDSDD
jgi:RNA polymerase sigma factor (sigma-70 family)